MTECDHTGHVVQTPPRPGLGHLSALGCTSPNEAQTRSALPCCPQSCPTCATPGCTPSCGAVFVGPTSLASPEPGVALAGEAGATPNHVKADGLALPAGGMGTPGHRSPEPGAGGSGESHRARPTGSARSTGKPRGGGPLASPRPSPLPTARKPDAPAWVTPRGRTEWGALRTSPIWRHVPVGV